MASRGPRTKVLTSTIHGKGLFAWDFIPKDAVIGEYVGPPAVRDSMHTLWVQNAAGKYLRGRRGTNKFRFVNHSKTPNAEFQDFKLVAIEDIPPTIEVTVHYGDEWEDG